MNKISPTRQKLINEQFWKLGQESRKLFLFNSLKKFPKKRDTTKSDCPARKVFSCDYFLKDDNNIEIKGCKIFLLATLGFEPANDGILKDVRNTDTQLIAPPSDKRHSSNKKIDRSDIIQHINSFGPSISHYRREHAPNRKYLPSDINITLMYKDFKNKYPDTNFSYELYRQVVSDENISFSKLGHEECWECESFHLHRTNVHPNEDAVCGICKTSKAHERKAISAREEYRRDAEKLRTVDDLCVSADLQKVT